MRFSSALISGVFLRRYKRFFADVRLDDGRVVTAHCPNTGAMSSCQKEGWRVLLSESTNPARKLAYTWELVHNGRCWICVNTARANQLVAEALHAGIVRELSGEFPPGDEIEIRREAAWSGGEGRCDFLLAHPAAQAVAPGTELAGDGRRAGEPRRCYIEVKSVTLKKAGLLQFPDAPTSRGRKHLEALMNIAEAGDRAVMLFLAQRSDAHLLRPAREIDPQYALLLKQAQEAGVELLAYQSKITRKGMRVARPLAIELE